MNKILTIFLFALLTVSYLYPKQNYKIFKRILSKRINIGAAPRAFTGIYEGYIFFTEKAPVPNNFRTGSVYRKLYSIQINSKKSEMLALMGNVFSHPVIDNKNKRIFFNRRTMDTDKDGTISRRDNGIICSVSFNGKSKTVWTKNNHNFQLMSISKKHDKLLMLEGKSIYEMDIKNTAEISLIKACGFYPAAAFYDKKDKIICIDTKGRLYKIKNKSSGKSVFSICMYNSKKIKILNSTNEMIFLSNKTKFTIPSKDIEYLFPLHQNIHVFLKRSFGRKKIFIGNIKTGEFQNIFKFPADTTRISISADRLSLSFLTTFDSDNNGILEPGQMDKSLIFYIQLGLNIEE